MIVCRCVFASWLFLNSSLVARHPLQPSTLPQYDSLRVPPKPKHYVSPNNHQPSRPITSHQIPPPSNTPYATLSTSYNPRPPLHSPICMHHVPASFPDSSSRSSCLIWCPLFGQRSCTFYRLRRRVAVVLRRCFPWLCRRVHENESSDSADRKNGAGGGHPHFVTNVEHLSGNVLHVDWRKSWSCQASSPIYQPLLREHQLYSNPFIITLSYCCDLWHLPVYEDRWM